MRREFLYVIIGIILFSLSVISPAQAKWWDRFGEPQYGGTLTVRTFPLAWVSFDPALVMGPQAYQWEYESLFTNDWTVDRDIWSFKPGFVPPEYMQGLLAESWEQIDLSTVRIKLRKGIHWQNKPPVNGRELTAEDVQYSCDRMLGTGSGFTQRNFMANMMFPNVERVVATDKYTVEVHFNQKAALNLLQLGNLPLIVAREWVELGPPPAEGPPPGGPPPGGGPPKGGPPKGGPPKGGPPVGAQSPLQDWKNAVGTGPWTVSDYVPGSSMTFDRYPDYWGHDERHSQNQVPYLDHLRVIEINDPSTALAALRSNRIDLSTISIQQSLQLAKTNPEFQIDYWPGPAYNLDMRCDHKPFTDINVRKALQMSINRKAIAKTLYGGISDGIPCGLMSPLLQGWAYSYDQWPEELKQEYGYNPERAKKLLAEAGYPDGFKTNMVVSSAQDKEIFNIIQSFFKDINVDLDVKTMDATALEPFQNAGKHDQITVETKAGAPGGPQMQLQLRWSKGPQNYVHNNDAHYDELFEQYLAAPDMDKLKQACVALDKYALENHWAVTILPTFDPVAVAPWVKGFSGELMILGSAPGVAYARWWIDKGLKK